MSTTAIDINFQHEQNLNGDKLYGCTDESAVTNRYEMLLLPSADNGKESSVAIEEPYNRKDVRPPFVSDSYAPRKRRSKREQSMLCMTPCVLFMY